MIVKGHLNRRATGTSGQVSRYLLTFGLAVVLLLSITNNAFAGIPVVDPDILPDGQVGEYYSYTFSASDLDGTDTWYKNGNIPGLNLSSSTGTLAGTPTTAGTYDFSIRVRESADSNDYSAWEYFTLTIDPAAFYMSTSSVPNGKEAASYSATFTAYGGTTPYTWAVTNGSLPPGLSLSGSGNYGYLTGTPNKGSSGSYSFTIEVTDDSPSPLTAQRSYTIYIEKGSFQPTVSIDAGLQSGYTKVKANNAQVASLTGGESYTLDLGLGETRTITVDPIVAHPSDEGVRFKVAEDTQVVSETQTAVVFSYYTEYKVDIFTNPSGIGTFSGSNWYKKDSSISLTAKEQISSNEDTSYRFVYWLLPNNQQVESAILNYTVDAPQTITAFYDTYYKLSFISDFGEVDGEGFYKAGSQPTWSVVTDKIPMEGFLGFFQGKYKAVTPNGSVTMNEPRTVTVQWKPDYTLPYILIPLAIILVALAVVGLYLWLRRTQPTPAPAAYGPPPYAGAGQMMGPRPVPQQHTTVVMIGDQGDRNKQLPGGTTKQQLVEKFAQLLDTYEAEIKSSMGIKETPQIKGVDGKMLAAPEPGQVMEAEVVKDVSICGMSTKKLLRTVASKWRQQESTTVAPPSESEKTEEGTGLLVTWARDIYHEWEITTCTLPLQHKGRHRGDTRIVYSPLNTVTFKQAYNPEQKIKPPTAHFTDSMPEEEPDESSIMDAEELPPQTI